MVRLWEGRAGGEGLEGLDLDHMKNLGNIGLNSRFISEEMEAQRGEVTCPMSHSNEFTELELEPGPQDSTGFGPPKEMGSLGRTGTCTTPRTSVLGRKRSCAQEQRWGRAERRGCKAWLTPGDLEGFEGTSVGLCEPFLEIHRPPFTQ